MVCTYYAKKRRNSKRKYLLRFFAVAAVVLLLVLLLEFYVNPIILSNARVQTRQAMTQAVNTATMSALGQTEEFSSMLKIERDADNNITAINTDAALVNKVHLSVMSAVRESVRFVGSSGCRIPLGTLTGIVFLSGKGKDVVIRVVPLGVVDGQLSSDFQSAGINQTHYRISLSLTVTLEIVLATKVERTDFETEVLICDGIIVGKVPDILLHELGAGI